MVHILSLSVWLGCFKNWINGNGKKVGSIGKALEKKYE
jgi:hypothetical protein